MENNNNNGYKWDLEMQQELPNTMNRETEGTKRSGRIAN